MFNPFQLIGLLVGAIMVIIDVIMKIIITTFGVVFVVLGLLFFWCRSKSQEANSQPADHTT